MTRKQKILNGISDFIKEKESGFQDIRLENLNEITAGWEAELFSFVLYYKHNGEEIVKKLVIRMYPSISEIHKLDTEYLIYKLLADLHYSVPKVYYKAKDLNYVGKPFLIMDWLTGGTLDEKLRSQPQESMLLFCQLFVELHDLDWKPYSEKLLSNGISILSIDSLLKRYENRIKQNNLTELQPINAWLKKRRKEVNNLDLSITHCDFHPYNILLNDEGDTFVIDWPSVKITDYRFDLASTLVLNRIYSGKNLRDTLFRLYQQIAQKEIEDIDFFEVIAIFRRMIGVMQVLLPGDNRIGLSDDIVDIIIDTIFHVENMNNYLEELTGIRIEKIDDLVNEAKNSIK
ncbi:MAG: phosphotransferase [Candidatus Heimdallarchaeota archaeon]|nr:phosphotransferase [Candidatus Heimdallarchaeota archaeon]